MRVLTGAEAAEVAAGRDATSQLLIQRAGYAVAQFCITEFQFRSICVICGQGKNGRVGIAAATILAGTATRVWVIVLAGRPDGQTPGADEALPRTVSPLWILEESDFDGEAAREAMAADLIVDAIVGTGFQPPLRPLACAAVAAINRASGTVVSVDVPSGVESDSVDPIGAAGGNLVFAQGILALMAPKRAHICGDLTVGPTAVGELGIQPALVRDSRCGRLSVLTGQDVCVAFPRRHSGMTEAESGHVLIIGGGRGSAAAAALAALAALRAGAGRVTIACPKSAEAIVAAYGAALFTHALPETNSGAIAVTACDQIGELLAGKHTVLIGPGLRVNPQTEDFVRRLTADSRVPVVISGAALAAFAQRSGESGRSTQPGTFHVICLDVGEAVRWLGGTAPGNEKTERASLAKTLSLMTGACVVLQGSPTVIAGPFGETWINLSGGPALAKAGMSETLVGVTGAALARICARDAPDWTNVPSNTESHTQFVRDLQVAAAVHLHGLAADIACNLRHEHALLPENVLEALPAAFRACDRQAESGIFYLRT